ncbi:phenylacetaldoxime dehydratase family protein, partial [Halalkalibacterium halodurans]|nr:phenylacetaldoxime dehydratase family protein [Halalkalibacterium halodurans]MED4107164.1 phenylacetaldoxime dehydratase family protein [Halalkalibacterium halodurans]MED4192958.1 phenylacetaldoxime dehydratase family protein [Halalkalibacterium halodurans]MED4223673.1 phenylacetaldoxime dehydratase family protein [Halalkalibacterium halodurans]
NLLTVPLFIPTNHIETLHSGENINGVSNFSPLQYTKVHDYWGSMRDRIPASKHHNFNSLYKKDNLKPMVSNTKENRIRVYLPDNFCIIRTAQNWSECSDEERDTYLSLVEPVLKQGEDYIRNNPTETGCLSSKFVYEISLAGDSQDKSCVIAYFLSLSDLEDWSRAHPLHLNIYKTFFKMLEKYNFKTELALWHEVSVLKKEQAIFEYINCHSKTGLLPYSELQVTNY